MDLTLDTPPETPPQNSPPNIEQADEPGSLSKPENTLSILQVPSQQTKPAPFFWHYVPQPDLKPPDPPDLVLASMSNNEATKISPMLLKRANFNHVVVRATDEERDASGFLGWFRGALSAITSTCIPLHSCGSAQRGMLHPGSPFIHPELRPPHVIAKAAKISLPMMAQPRRAKAESEESIFRIPRDATLKSECPSTETETTFTTDVASDKGSHAPSEDDKVSKRDSQNMNRSLLSNRNSLMYGTFAEEEEENSKKQVVSNQAESGGKKPWIKGRVKDETDNDVQNRDEENNQSHDSFHDLSTTTRSDLSDLYDLDEDLPLINFSTNNQVEIFKIILLTFLEFCKEMYNSNNNNNNNSKSTF